MENNIKLKSSELISQLSKEPFWKVQEKVFSFIVECKRDNINELDSNVLNEKFGYDISTYTDNNIGYYITNDPETDFEPGEIRAIIDTFSYSTFIEENLSKGIIKKCKNLQTVYENEKIKNYKVYSPKGRTRNVEVIKNIEIEPISNDEFKMKLSVDSLGFKLWTMRNLDMVKILKPAKLVSEIKKVIEDANKRYDS